jgi:hypothetical protein
VPETAQLVTNPRIGRSSSAASGRLISQLKNPCFLCSKNNIPVASGSALPTGLAPSPHDFVIRDAAKQSPQNSVPFPLRNAGRRRFRCCQTHRCQSVDRPPAPARAFPHTQVEYSLPQRPVSARKSASYARGNQAQRSRSSLTSRCLLMYAPATFLLRYNATRRIFRGTRPKGSCCKPAAVLGNNVRL